MSPTRCALSFRRVPVFFLKTGSTPVSIIVLVLAVVTSAGGRCFSPPRGGLFPKLSTGIDDIEAFD